MLNTNDEIIFRFAAILDELPIPSVPQPGELITKAPTSPKTPTESKAVPKPIEIVPSTEEEPKHGSAEWAAKNYTEEFLKGVKQPYRGWIRDPANKMLVQKTMDELVAKNPENYFSWDLYRRQELKPWIYLAATSLIKKDPIAALMKEIYRFNELKDLQTELWKAALDKEISRSVFDSSSSGQIFINALFNKMRHLAGLIATTDPEFYSLFIVGKPITTKQFDEEAKRILRQKEELGKYTPIKPKYKTKL